jgi:hypothetical protein
MIKYEETIQVNTFTDIARVYLKAGIMSTHFSSHSISLPDELLNRLVAELDDETVRAIILRGSYARGDAIAPYSDIDFTRMIQDHAGHTLPKRFFWRDGYLVSVSTHSYAAYRERLNKPEQAIFAVTGIQEAQVLLDKDGAFPQFQQEALKFRWEPLQMTANRYAGQRMMELSEIILRLLKVLRWKDEILLTKMLLDIIGDLTEVVAVQRGVLVKGQTYFHQVQAAVGQYSAWTRYQQCAAGFDPEQSAPLSLDKRGKAALRLYQETFALLQSALFPEHRDAIAPLIVMIEQALTI